MLRTLLAIENRETLLGHPRLGASWEGFAIEAVVARLGARREETFFWGTHNGAELDLLVVRGLRRLGFELKRTVAPHVTRKPVVGLRLGERQRHGKEGKKRRKTSRSFAFLAILLAFPALPS